MSSDRTIVIEGKKNLIRAAEAAGVKRMIPSDYSVDYFKLDYGDSYIIALRILLGLIFLIYGLDGFWHFLPPHQMSEQTNAFIEALIDSGFIWSLMKGTIAKVLADKGYRGSLAALIRQAFEERQVEVEINHRRLTKNRRTWQSKAA